MANDLIFDARVDIDTKTFNAKFTSGESPGALGNNYENLKNLPTLNGVTILGNRDSAYYKLQGLMYPLTEEEMDTIVNGGEIPSGDLRYLNEFDAEYLVKFNVDTYMSKNDAQIALGNKVDKIPGRGLSETNFTQAEKTKLANLVIGGEPNKINEIAVNGVIRPPSSAPQKRVSITIPTRLGQLQNDSNYQTLNQVNESIAEALSEITSFKFEIVDVLPAEGQNGIIYLVLEDESTSDIYNEYAWIDGQWEKLGSTAIKIEDYVTKEQLVTDLSELEAQIRSDYLLRLDNKVDKQAGMGLSETNFSYQEKSKLASLSVDAERNRIEEIYVNNQFIPPDTNRQVHIVVPRSTAELINNSDFQTSTDVEEAIEEALGGGALDDKLDKSSLSDNYQLNDSTRPASTVATKSLYDALNNSKLDKASLSDNYQLNDSTKPASTKATKTMYDTLNAVDQTKLDKTALSDNYALNAANRAASTVATKNLYDDVVQDIHEDYDPLIPNTASASNQLVDKNFVNSSIQQMAANRVTYDPDGDGFPSRAALWNATTVYFQGVPYTPTQHDYAIVEADEGAPAPFTTGQTRHEFDGTKWVYDYGINDRPFTAAENAAISSGITAAIVNTISTPDNVPTNGSAKMVKSGGVFSWFGSAVSALTTSAKTVVAAINELVSGKLDKTALSDEYQLNNSSRAASTKATKTMYDTLASSITGRIAKTDMKNNLTTSTSGQGPLDAYQGYLLNQNKIDKSSMKNNLTTTTAGQGPLDAYQGYVLDKGKVPLRSAVVTTGGTVTNNFFKVAEISGMVNLQRSVLTLLIEDMIALGSTSPTRFGLLRVAINTNTSGQPLREDIEWLALSGFDPSTFILAYKDSSPYISELYVKIVSTYQNIKITIITEAGGIENGVYKDEQLWTLFNNPVSQSSLPSGYTIVPSTVAQLQPATGGGDEENLISNWEFRNSIGVTGNQSGIIAKNWNVTTIADSSRTYSIDSNGLNISNTSTSPATVRHVRIPKANLYSNKNITLSIKMTSLETSITGNIMSMYIDSFDSSGALLQRLSRVTTISEWNSLGDKIFKLTGTLIALPDNSEIEIIFNCQPNVSYTIESIKLELGSVSTLATDSPPNYNEEFLRTTGASPSQTNPNILDNSWFQVWQGGDGPFIGTGYNADMWQSNSANLTVTRNASGEIHFSITSSGAEEQVFSWSDFDIYLGKTLTLSILYGDGTYDYGSVTIPTARGAMNLGFTTKYGGRLQIYTPNASTPPRFQIYFARATELDVTAVKMELGSVSTLANDSPPNYNEEFLRTTGISPWRAATGGGDGRNSIINAAMQINQPGASEYATARYTLDGFYLTGSNRKVTIANEYVRYEPTVAGQGSQWLRQPIENYAALAGKTVTLSIRYKRPTVEGSSGISLSLNIGANDYLMEIPPSDTETIITRTIALPAAITALMMGVRISSTVLLGDYIEFPRDGRPVWKLELGSVSTLANDGPVNYNEELQRIGPSPYTITLSFSQWYQENLGWEQSVTIPTLLPDSQFLYDIDPSATPDQAKTFMESGIRSINQRENAVIFRAEFSMPGMDIPLTAMILRR